MNIDKTETGGIRSIRVGLVVAVESDFVPIVNVEALKLGLRESPTAYCCVVPMTNIPLYVQKDCIDGRGIAAMLANKSSYRVLGNAIIGILIDHMTPEDFRIIIAQATNRSYTSGRNSVKEELAKLMAIEGKDD